MKEQIRRYRAVSRITHVDHGGKRITLCTDGKMFGGSFVGVCAAIWHELEIMYSEEEAR